MNKTKISALKASAAPVALGLALIATPAAAQDASATAPQLSEEQQEQGYTSPIIVTGSILRRVDTETPAPVTVLSAQSLEERGLNTVSEAVQRLSANNAGTIQQGWNTGFNFASGANAPALRGLTVQATLSIADGLRLAPYPLADDGQRNFVDLNTIPTAIVDRVEVLRDGASSTYGADAIAGVVNVITKKEIQGIHLNGSAGISQRGDAGEQRIDATIGYGDLDTQGFNVYVSGEYQKQDTLYARDRGYPFNSADLQGICNAAGSCMVNHNWNGITTEDGSFNGLISIPGVTLIRPVPTDEDTAGAGRYDYLNAAAGCRNWRTVTITEDMSATSPLQTCEVDYQNAYIQLQPQIERKGVSARFTANLGDSAQVYAMGNLYETTTRASFTPLGFNGTPAAPTNGATPYNVLLPVYVCATGVGTQSGLGTGCDATNGVLNPYNPYAAEGLRAQALLRSPNGRSVETKSRSLRGVLGLEGSIADEWRYAANFTASEVRLDRIQEGYLNPRAIMNAVARGEFNFADPLATPQSVWDTISPHSNVRSVSKLWQVQGTISRDLFELPGGPLQVAVGGAYRDESINAPSGNPGNTVDLYDRYYSLNAVGTKGSRHVTSGFFEVGAPILDQLEVNVSGRYDKYSTGQKNFSPKVGVKVTPVEQVALRGTWSKGFRIPSFNEAFGLPTTGFVTRTLDCAKYTAFCAAHGNNAYATQPFSLGITSVGNPQLDPEKSTAFTLGAVFEPIRNVSLTVDYWHIKVKDLIVGVTDTSAPLEAYYLNNGVVNLPGVTVTPSGTIDQAFPNALPHLGTIEASFRNANQQTVSGLDFGINARFPLTDDLTWIVNGDASYMIKYDLDVEGVISNYAGSLGPCNNTSCSGVPKWRGSLQNTLKYKGTTVSLTAYYTSGYDNAAVDAGDIIGDCEGNAANGNAVQTYVDGTPVQCRAKPTWNVDMTLSQKLNNNFTLYANVLNVFDIDPPLDTASTYQLFQFNPAWAGPNIMGRYFRIGAKVDF